MYENENSTDKQGVPCSVCGIAKGIEIESDHIMIKSYSLGDDGYYYEEKSTPVTVQKIVIYTCSDCGNILDESNVSNYGKFNKQEV